VGIELTPEGAKIVSETRSIVGRVSHYVLAHERLIIICIAAVLLWVGIGKIENYKLVHDQHAYDAKVAQLQQTVDKNAQQAAINAQAAAQNKQLADQYQAAAASAQAANAQLEQATAALLQAVKQAKANDAKLPTPELGAHIAVLAKVPPSTITANKDDSLNVTHDGAVGIAVALEDLPVLNTQVANLLQEKANLNGQITSQGKLVTGLNTQVAGQLTQIGGLQLELKQADGVCQAQIKVVKDEARKGKRKFFIIGYVAGLATRGAAKIFFGI
jgi:hypothetical protein